MTESDLDFDAVAQNLAEVIVDLLKAPRDRDRLIELVVRHVRRAITIGYRGRRRW